MARDAGWGLLVGLCVATAACRPPEHAIRVRDPRRVKLQSSDPLQPEQMREGAGPWQSMVVVGDGHTVKLKCPALDFNGELVLGPGSTLLRGPRGPTLGTAVTGARDAGKPAKLTCGRLTTLFSYDTEGKLAGVGDVLFLVTLDTPGDNLAGAIEMKHTWGNVGAGTMGFGLFFGGIFGSAYLWAAKEGAMEQGLQDDMEPWVLGSLVVTGIGLILWAIDPVTEKRLDR